jgi:predicted Zn finger-like uncharacterized protein
MILTCPKCATRYLVEDSEMRAEGRKVRCSVCGEEWRVERGAAADDESPPPLAPVADHLGTNAAESGGVEVAAAGDAEAAATSVLAAEPLSLPPREAPAPAEDSPFVSPIGARARTPAKPAPKPRSGANWGLAALVILAVVVILFGFRREIVRAWPAAGGVYAALGIPATPRPAAAPSPNG